ncbi:MAG: DUF5011 domain-containing protein [Bacteroidota bacterium]|nr:DUF5011 domain-containing protein [Bacteroidota bacterium]
MNKNILKYLAIVIFALSFGACDLVIDEDTTENISIVSVKPVITVLGEQIISMEVGGSYTDAGADADAGDNDFDLEIVSGNVDPSTAGFYLVTYKAENEYNWVSYAYRSVLVHDGTPYYEDISGGYKAGNQTSEGYQFESQVAEAEGLNGYWTITNVWLEEGVTAPIYFADNDDGTYSVVPYEHERKGIIFGTAEKVIEIDEFNIEYEFLVFQLEVHTKSGKILNKEMKWEVV